MIEKDVKVFVSVAEGDHDGDAMTSETGRRSVKPARLNALAVLLLNYFQRLNRWKKERRKIDQN